MKAYTDLEQSKKLAGILSLDSADMCFANDGTSIKIDANPYTVRYSMWKNYVVEVIPAWSLAALLEQLDDSIVDDYGYDWQLEIHKEDGQYYLNYHDRWEGKNDLETDYYDDLVDACVDMIEKLHKQKLL